MYIQVEVSQSVDELDRVASHAQFNGMNLLWVDLRTSFFKWGSNCFNVVSHWAIMDQRTQIFIGTMTSTDLAFGKLLPFYLLSTPDGANIAIGTVDNALKILNKQRADQKLPNDLKWLR